MALGQPPTVQMIVLLFPIILLAIIVTTAMASFTAITYVTPERDQIWFRFTLTPGKFLPSNQIQIIMAQTTSWKNDFIPTNTTGCTFDTNYETNTKFLHIALPDTSTDTNIFEQYCNGYFKADHSIGMSLVYLDGEREDHLVYNTTVTPLKKMSTTTQPLFTPQFNLETTETPTPSPTGLPWAPGILSFQLNFDHELPLSRQAYLVINDIPHISDCSYLVVTAPVVPIPNSPRVADVQLTPNKTTGGTDATGGDDVDKYGLFTAVLELIHLPYLTHKVDEKYNAMYIFDDEDQDQDSTFTATLEFTCNAILPHESILRTPVLAPYTIQLVNTPNWTEPTFKYSALTNPLSQIPISLPTFLTPDYPVVKLTPRPVLLADSCEITSVAPTPTCPIQFTLGIDLLSQPQQITELVLPIGSTLTMTFDSQSSIFSAIESCTLVTVHPNHGRIITMTTIEEIKIGLEGVSTTTIQCQGAVLTGAFPSTSPPPLVSLVATRAPTQAETDAGFQSVPLAITQTTFSSTLKPNPSQTLLVSVTLTRQHHSQIQSSWAPDAPYVAMQVLEWGQDTLGATANFQEPPANFLLSDLFFETSSQQTTSDVDRLTVKLVYYGALPNIQRLIPIFVQNSTSDSTAGALLKSRLELIYVSDSQTTVEIIAETTFYPSSAVNKLLDSTETALDCGGPLPGSKSAVTTPRCPSGSQCVVDSDCQAFCGSTINFYQPMVTDTSAEQLQQIVRKRVYASGLCHNTATAQSIMAIILIGITFVVLGV